MNMMNFFVRPVKLLVILKKVKHCLRKKKTVFQTKKKWKIVALQALLNKWNIPLLKLIKHNFCWYDAKDHLLANVKHNSVGLKRLHKTPLRCFSLSQWHKSNCTHSNYYSSKYLVCCQWEYSQFLFVFLLLLHLNNNIEQKVNRFLILWNQIWIIKLTKVSIFWFYFQNAHWKHPP